MKMSKILVVVLLIAHFMACGWARAARAPLRAPPRRHPPPRAPFGAGLCRALRPRALRDRLLDGLCAHRTPHRASHSAPCPSHSAPCQVPIAPRCLAHGLIRSTHATPGSVHRGQAHEDVDGAGLGQQYVSAIYWAITTLTTVGYGDISPSTEAEYYYAIVAMVVGGLFYGLIVAQLSALMTAVDANGQRCAEAMDAVVSYMTVRKFPRPLFMKVRRSGGEAMGGRGGWLV